MRPARWFTRKVRAGAALTLALAAMAAAVHLPVARSRVLDVARSWVYLYDLSLSAVRLDYDALTLSVALERPQLAVKGARSALFTARRARADMALSALGGRVVFDTLEVSRPVVRLWNEDGSWNLPLERRAPRSGAVPVAVHRLRIDDLQLAGVGSTMAGGSFAQQAGPGTEGSHDWPKGAHGTTESLQTRLLEVTSVEGSVRFDGSALDVVWLSVGLGENQFWLKGTIGPRAHVEMALDGVVDLETAARWGAVTGLSGRAWISGTLEGPLAAPVATLTVAAPRANYRGVVIEALRARVVASRQGFLVKDLEASVSGRRMVASALGEALANWADTRSDMSHP